MSCLLLSHVRGFRCIGGATPSQLLHVKIEVSATLWLACAAAAVLRQMLDPMLFAGGASSSFLPATLFHVKNSTPACLNGMGSLSCESRAPLRLDRAGSFMTSLQSSVLHEGGPQPSCSEPRCALALALALLFALALALGAPVQAFQAAFYRLTGAPMRAFSLLQLRHQPSRGSSRSSSSGQLLEGLPREPGVVRAASSDCSEQLLILSV